MFLQSTLKLFLKIRFDWRTAAECQYFSLLKESSYKKICKIYLASLAILLIPIGVCQKGYWCTGHLGIVLPYLTSSMLDVQNYYFYFDIIPSSIVNTLSQYCAI